MPAVLVNAMTTVFTHFRPRLERIPIRTDEELAALRMPVLAVVGGRDALLRSSETRDRLTRLVPGARVAYLEPEGHILPPQATAIADFLAADAAIPPSVARPLLLAKRRHRVDAARAARRQEAREERRQDQKRRRRGERGRLGRAHAVDEPLKDARRSPRAADPRSQANATA